MIEKVQNIFRKTYLKQQKGSNKYKNKSNSKLDKIWEKTNKQISSSTKFWQIYNINFDINKKIINLATIFSIFPLYNL